jgi:hypothetical protein
MPTKKRKPAPQKPSEPRQVSPEIRAGIDQFSQALAHIVLVKIDPEAARRTAENES